jgi:hypothetical protein
VQNARDTLGEFTGGNYAYVEKTVAKVPDAKQLVLWAYRAASCRLCLLDPRVCTGIHSSAMSKKAENRRGQTSRRSRRAYQNEVSATVKAQYSGPKAQFMADFLCYFCRSRI